MHNSHFHYDLILITIYNSDLILKSRAVEIGKVFRKSGQLSLKLWRDKTYPLFSDKMIYDRVTYCVIWILSVIVVALEFFLLTLGKIFWIVNASLLVSISAIGLLWKEKWKMMLVRYQASTDGTQVRQEEEDRWTPPPDYNLVNNLQPRSPAPAGLPLPSNKTTTSTNSICSTSWSNPEVKLEAVNHEHDDSGLPTYEQALSQI